MAPDLAISSPTSSAASMRRCSSTKSVRASSNRSGVVGLDELLEHARAAPRLDQREVGLEVAEVEGEEAVGDAVGAALRERSGSGSVSGISRSTRRSSRRTCRYLLAVGESTPTVQRDVPDALGCRAPRPPGSSCRWSGSESSVRRRNCDLVEQVALRSQHLALDVLGAGSRRSSKRVQVGRHAAQDPVGEHASPRRSQLGKKSQRLGRAQGLEPPLAGAPAEQGRALRQHLALHEGDLAAAQHHHQLTSSCRAVPEALQQGGQPLFASHR